MREVNLQDFKQLALSILIDFDSVCRENNIRYTIAYGTLLGAIRHNGFIPWDDDIDVIMPRSDYDKFLEHCDELESNHEFVSFHNNSECTSPLAKIIDTKTTLRQYKVIDGVKLGVYIDVFVFDYIPDNVISRNFIYKVENQLQKLWTWSTKRKDGGTTNNSFVKKKIARFVTALMHLCAKSTKSSSQYGNLLYAVYPRNKDVMEKDDFNTLQNVPFEGNSVLAVSSAKELLTAWYGDYMTLPPEDKRVSHHEFDAWWNE